MNNKPQFTNNLIHAESPYLKQHAHNPVNWNNWEDETWQKAENEQKLVIISIGYSTCHWCHVMEKECFEDIPTAQIMNAHFVSIKVDREERPDVDQIYMDACQIMTGRGGWPLNVVCLPNKKPVYAGTYFPKEHWQSLLNQLAELWKKDSEKVYEYADRIVNGIWQMNLGEFPTKAKISKQDLSAITLKMSQSFDYVHGGLQRSQKFPLPGIYEYLLDDYLCTGNTESLDFANFSLLKMANSGIFDHLRGGFYRYATDVQWFAPHFEKMLYDNAQLASLYARAFSITQAPIYKEVAERIIDFIESELKHLSGGYSAALDADSEGIEGRYYVFTSAELETILDQSEMELAQLVFNFKPEGNWEHGFNILHRTLSPAQILEDSGLSAIEYQAKLSVIKSKLLELQNNRIRPSLDHKIICSWNGLYLQSLANAGRYLKNNKYTELATELAHWMIKSLKSGTELMRTFTNSQQPIPAFSEDYACFVAGLIALYESDGNATWLNEATRLADALITDFYDAEKSLFAFTPLNQEPLLLHKYDVSDDVIPATNSMMCEQLKKLGILMERMDFGLLANEMIKNMRSQILENPEWHSNWARSAQAEAIGMLQVATTGVHAHGFRQELQGQIPSWSVMGIESNASSNFIKHKTTGESKIYICVNETCLEPVNSTAEATEIIEDIFLGN